MTLTKIDDRGLKTPIDLLDNEKIRLGTGNDLELSHSGTNSSIDHKGTGSLFIHVNNNFTLKDYYSNDLHITAIKDGAVNLYYDNNKKLETTSTGVTVSGDASTGTIIQGAFSLRDTSSSSDRIKWIPNSPYVLRWADNFKASFGFGDDLQIFHDGTHSRIKNSTGDLFINSDTVIRLQSFTGSETMAKFFQNGAVELYHDNDKKIETLSTGAKVTGDLEVTGGITSTSRTNRNLIINGAMTVAQRGTSSTDTGYRTVDRFRVTYGGLNENLTQEQVDVASGTTPYTLGFRKAFKITNGNQTGGAGTNDFIIFGYKAEAQDIANSGWNYKSSSSYVTLSFWIKSSVAQDFKGHLYTPDGTQQIYAFATGSLSANTWTKVTKTIPGHSNITIDNDNGEGFHVNIAPFFGTSFTSNSVTEDAWATYNSATRMKDNTSTWYTTNDATLEITGMQLEVGSVATDFEHLPYCDVMRRCMRYFYATRGDGTLGGVNNYASGIFGFGLNGNIVGGGFRYPEPMRAAPSLTLIRPSDGATNGLHLFRGVTGSHGGVDKTSSAVTFVDVGRYGYLYITFSINVIDQGGGFLYHIIASAEL